MRLLLDGSGGFAGDMFTAALIDAGADIEAVKHNMMTTGKKLGDLKIDLSRSGDGSSQLNISLAARHDHILAAKVVNMLDESFEELKTGTIYREFGHRVLDILISAENEAHKLHVFDRLNQHHGHKHEGTVLHEAQDILIDIIGSATAMESLGVSPEASLFAPVRTGSGTVEFSHGILDVPAPATRIILEKYNIEWKKGPVDTELCTPTGASLLAAIITPGEKRRPAECHVSAGGSSRGSKILPIPPLKIYIV